MTKTDSSDLYDSCCFAHGCGERPYQRDEEWLRYFYRLAERIVSDIRPKTVLDAGCAMGFLVEGLRKEGVEAYGIDVSEYALSQVHPDIEPYCWEGSITEPFHQRYDLITCIDVLEHLPVKDGEDAIENLCRFSDDILFSSTPFDYKEATHYNVQPPSYWVYKFAQQGFFRDVDFDGSFITPWAIRFRRRKEPVHRLIREYERGFWLLWKENTDLRSLIGEMRVQLKQTDSMVEQVNQMVEQIHQLQLRNAQLEDILQSRSWRALQCLQKLRHLDFSPLPRFEPFVFSTTKKEIKDELFPEVKDKDSFHEKPDK